MNRFVAINPVEARKAAAFVEALNDVEQRFGYTLAAEPNPVSVAGAVSPFAVVRGPEGGLSLVLEIQQ